MWEILTRRLPWSDDSDGLGQTQWFSKDIIAAVRAGQRPSVSDAELDGVDPDYLNIMDVCWSQSPARRPKMSAVSRMLDGLISRAGTGSEIWPPLPPRPQAEPASRGRAGDGQAPDVRTRGLHSTADTPV